MSFDIPSSKPSPKKINRIFGCIYGQKKKTIACPPLPRLYDKRVLVTGGIAGVGEFISRGLLERGAKVATMSRGQSQGTKEISEVFSLTADLADPDSIVSAVNELGDVPIDLLVCNAGLVSKHARKTVAGVENTFGVNVLGHHILYRLLIDRNMLAHDARIIITTGEIYASATDCSSNIPYDSMGKAYARSKLGNLWQVAELTRQYPTLHPIAVHPGVVASGFVGAKKTGFLAWLRRAFLISEEAGAQASLIAATQDIPRGAYWHNTMGIVDLPTDDLALDFEKSSRLWGQLENLAAPYLA